MTRDQARTEAELLERATAAEAYSAQCSSALTELRRHVREMESQRTHALALVRSAGADLVGARAAIDALDLATRLALTVHVPELQRVLRAREAVAHAEQALNKEPCACEAIAAARITVTPVARPGLRLVPAPTMADPSPDGAA